jgi:Lipopolysaccharide assembly protein A domain
MIRSFVKAIVIIPTFAVLVAWAIANHQPVTVSFNPFDSSDPELAVTVPLYLAGFIVLIAGVVLGGFAAWLMQSKLRRIGSRLAAENVMIRTELADLKGQMARPEGRSPTQSVNRTLPAA